MLGSVFTEEWKVQFVGLNNMVLSGLAFLQLACYSFQ